MHPRKLQICAPQQGFEVQGRAGIDSCVTNSFCHVSRFAFKRSLEVVFLNMQGLRDFAQTKYLVT
jgi:hypothetical protein